METTYHFRPRDWIVEQIECYIIENNLKPGDKLPSERALCKLWGCNHLTLRAALNRLSVEGKLYSVKNIGSFVAEEKLERYLQDLQSFSEFAASKNKSVANHIVSTNILASGRKLSQSLQIPLGREVFELVRLRIVDGCPLAIEKAYFSLDRFPELNQFDFEKHSVYQVLKENYQQEAVDGDEEIGLTQAADEVAELLSIEAGSAVFLIRQISYDKGKIPVEYVESISRPDKIKFASMLRR